MDLLGCPGRLLFGAARPVRQWIVDSGPERKGKRLTMSVYE